MKRIIACLLLVLLACISLPVCAGAEHTYILLRPENFVLPDPVGTWRLSKPTRFNDMISGTSLNCSSTTEPATVCTVYIPADNTYTFWGLGYDYSGGVTNRHAKIGFDGKYDAAEFGSPIPGMSWTKCASPVYLEKGTHTVQVRAGYPTMTLWAIMITDDAELVLSAETVYEDISMYEDIKAPVIDGEIISDGENILFPAAEDETGLQMVQYFVGEKEVVAENGVYPFPEILPLCTCPVKMRAHDMHGNIAETEAMFYNAVVIPSVYTVTQSGGQVVMNATFTNRTDGAMTVMASLACYNTAYTRMIDVKTEVIQIAAGEEGSATVTLPVSTGNCNFTGMLWDDSENAQPLVRNATLEVRSGA